VKQIGAFVALILIGALLGAGVNAVRSDGLAWYVPKNEIYRPPPPPDDPDLKITREDVLQASQSGRIIIDARNEEKYRNGHVPGALNIPSHSVQDNIDRVFAYAGPNDYVLVYCGGAECEDSHTVADAMKANGYTNVHIYYGGWQKWTEHEMPVEEGDPYADNGDRANEPDASIADEGEPANDEAATLGDAQTEEVQ
jgi:3-mercaptopyruvate sulfurtransferase SseA